MRQFTYDDPTPGAYTCVFYEDGTYQCQAWPHPSYWRLVTTNEVVVLEYKHDVRNVGGDHAWQSPFNLSDAMENARLTNILLDWIREGEFYQLMDGVLE